MKITDSNLSANSFPESTGIRRTDNIQPHRAEFLNIEAKSNHQSHDKTSCGENVFRLQTSVDLQYVKDDTATPMLPYREAVCALCEKTVSLALGISLEGLLAKTRCNAETALARQIAMYLCHTTFSLLLTEIGVHFGRDRTTVSYACALVEDKRDDPEFDLMLSQLEALLIDARHAMSICIEHQPTANESLSNKDSGKPEMREKLLEAARNCR